MRIFYQLLGNTFVTAITNGTVWFAITFYTYLQTQSVFATSIISGIYLVVTAASGFWFGSLVDNYKKKIIMILSTLASLIFFLIAYIVYTTTAPEEFINVNSVSLWTLVVLSMAGVMVGNIRNIALPTLVTILVPEKIRDKANGMVGMVTGVSFLVTSVISGLLVGHSGMYWVLILGVAASALSIAHLWFVDIPEKGIVHVDDLPKKIDIAGTFKVISKIPGLLALILFATFNNFLGGVFMSLMDAYGLSLISVEAWGLLWGFLSTGFIIGGILISKLGLGKNPLRTLFLANILIWFISSVFTIQAWLPLLIVGMFVYISVVPFIEAAEHTIIQKVVPPERQGRVFGFAQSVEQTASPLTAFAIGPITQFFFIPFMTTGAGAELIGDWFGTGPDRGIALVFTITGIIGLIITLIAMKSKYYHLLSERYLQK